MATFGTATFDSDDDDEEFVDEEGLKEQEKALKRLKQKQKKKQQGKRCGTVSLCVFLESACSKAFVLGENDDTAAKESEDENDDVYENIRANKLDRCWQQMQEESAASTVHEPSVRLLIASLCLLIIQSR